MWGPNATQVDGESTDSAWQRAHRVLKRLARERAAADVEEARWLLAALRAAAHIHLGYATYHEYIERLFGYAPRATQDKLRVAEALEHLPATAHALQQGQLSWSAVRELTRVATADTEQEWLTAATDKTVREIERLVASTSPGDLPTTPRDLALCPRVLRFEVTAETYALFREAIRQLRRHSDSRLDDDAILMTMARSALHGPGDDGRSSYQVSLSQCHTCQHSAQLAAGELVPVAPAIAAMAQCDGQHITTHVGAPNADAHASASDAPTPRAKQTIAPARRRATLQRDQHRCRVPGCCNATFIDVHHIKARADGGDDQVENLIVLCAAHHRAVHRGELVIEGTSADALCFQHSDGSRYGEPSSPTLIDVHGKVFKALCKLGFGEGPVRRVLEALRREPGAAVVSAEALLREALGRLTR